MAERFAVLIRGRHPGGLADWLSGAESSSAAGLRSSARTLRQDEAAVRAGLTVEWSNGPVEGHVNRLKVASAYCLHCHRPSLDVQPHLERIAHALCRHSRALLGLPGVVNSAG
jgi:hypothetical protein